MLPVRMLSTQARVLGIAVVLAAIPAHAFAVPLALQPAPKTDSKTLPGAAELFDRYIDALGGQTAIRAIKSRTIAGSIVSTGRNAGTSQIAMRQIAPDKLVAVITPASGPAREVGYDGAKGWRRKGAEPAKEITGEELTQIKQIADIYQQADYKDIYKEMQTVRLTDFTGKPAYEVKAVDTQGKTSFLYFNPQDSLLLGHRQDQISPDGTASVTMVLSDYKQFGGVLHPTRIVQSADGQEVTTTYSEIRVNAADVQPIEAPPELVTKK